MLKEWRVGSYQFKLLVVLIVICLLPSALIGWLAYRKSQESLERKVIEDLQVIVTQFNNTLSAQVEELDRFSTFPYSVEEIFDIIASPSAPTELWDFAELGKQQRFIELITSYPSINNMVEAMLFYGTNGSMYGYRVSGVKTLDHSVDPRGEPWFKDAIDRNGGLVVSGLRMEDQFSGDPFETLTVARMLVDRKYEPAAVIAVDVKPDFIRKTVRSLGFNKVHVTVSGPYGHVYSSHPLLTEQLLAGEALPIGDGEEPFPIAVSADIEGKREEWSGVRQYDDYTGWTTYLLVDRGELLQESAVIKDFTIFVVSLIGFAALALSWALAKGLSRPISSLIRSMREVERGNFILPEISLSGRKDELSQLLYSYNRMVLRLDGLVQSIGMTERLKREAELNALRARITPHFLFNTINSIRILAMIQRSDQIAELLRSLSQLINSNMRLDRELVTLQEELDFLRDYLNLMDLRYTDKFKVSWTVADDARSALVPAMILQPLVENAIFHGPDGIDGKLSISISAKLARHRTRLELTISDDGKGMPPELVRKVNAGLVASVDGNIGVRNVRDRIQFRFGEQYGLSIESESGLGTSAKLTMPRLTEGVGANNDVEHDGRGG